MLRIDHLLLWIMPIAHRQVVIRGKPCGLLKANPLDVAAANFVLGGDDLVTRKRYLAPPPLSPSLSHPVRKQAAPRGDLA